MRSTSLETLYNRLHNYIMLATAFYEIQELDFIIKACRLKPYKFIIEERSRSTTLYNHWFDEFNNSVIFKKKEVKIIYNDLKLINKSFTTDLYYKIDISKILKISKLCYISIYKNIEDNYYESTYFITLLGIDNYLRTFVFEDGWKQISSLSLGFESLKNLYKFREIRYFKNFSILENGVMPCEEATRWISYMPVSEEFLEEIKQFDEIYSLLK